jgi:hypothetical protein
MREPFQLLQFVQECIAVGPRCPEKETATTEEKEKDSGGNNNVAVAIVLRWWRSSKWGRRWAYTGWFW